MGTLEGLLSFHDFGPQGSCPGVGLEVQNLDTLSVMQLFSFMLTPKDIMLEVSHPYDMGFCVFRWRSVWPIFHAWMILPYILMTIWWMNVILGIMDHWLHKIYGGHWPVFHGPAILLNILKTIWWIYFGHLANESVRCKLWPQNKCKSQWPIFYGSSDFVLHFEDYLIYEGHT